jgi:signal transduction histidine kinase
MTVIGGFADILVSGWDEISDADKLEFLERIKDNIGRLSTLVDDILQVSRIEAGEVSMELAPVDVARLIRRTSEEVVTTFPGRRIEVDLPDDLPLVLGDEDRQWRVLSNLLSNALKFSEGDAPVEVSARVLGGDVEVAVTDHGHGIRPEDMGKLFQRFSRVQQPAGKNVKGTGLGLYITRSLVEAQGGRISVTSDLGKGSTFRYTVPVAKGDA